MKFPIWALAAFLLSLSLNVGAQEGNAKQAATPNPCLHHLYKDDNGKAYNDCIKNLPREAAGATCTIFFWIPGTNRIKRVMREKLGDETCPPNGLTEAEAQVAAWVAEQAAKDCAKKGKVTWNNLCLDACTGGKVRDGNPWCSCPHGTLENSQGNCDTRPNCTKNSDGTHTCQPNRTCTGGKYRMGGVCQCPSGQTENSQGICVSQPTQICTTDSEGNRTCSTSSTPDASDLHPTPLTNEEVYEQEQKIEQEINNQLNQQNCSIAGQIRDSQGVCVWPPCTISGQTRNAQGTCVYPPCPSPTSATQR